MSAQFLTIRVAGDDSMLMSRLHSNTGLTKSERRPTLPPHLGIYLQQNDN